MQFVTCILSFNTVKMLAKKESHNTSYYNVRCHCSIKIIFHNHNLHPLLYIENKQWTSRLGRFFQALEVSHINCNIGTRDLLHMYVCPQPLRSGPWALSIHIRQISYNYYISYISINRWNNQPPIFIANKLSYTTH